MKTILHSNLWRRWVAANALGEFLGLGLTIGVFALVFTRLGEARGIGMTLAVFALEVSAGAIEATIVGLAQWWAMHPWFPGISRRAWWLSTLAGALFAYILGFLPSTLMSLGEQAAPEAAPMTEPPQWIVMLLAAAMGLAAGAVLSFAQWLVLRKKARGAGLWIPANMLAWAAGMPIIFWGIDAAQKGLAPALAALLLGGALLLTGAIVGAIHGAFLIRTVRTGRSEPDGENRIKSLTG